MKSRILCFCAGLCLLAVFACDSNKTGPPKTFSDLNPDVKPKNATPPKPEAPPVIKKE